MRARQICLAAIASSVLALLVAAGPAAATSQIEGVWSFNGGSVAVQPLSNGTFVGTVVAPTDFAQCAHPVGEQVWTDLRLQPDGSYFGLHQWYFEGSCIANPRLGLTAWRVLTTSGGARFLRVCFSSPGTAQPVIAADGTSTNVSYGCVDSSLIAPLPAASGVAAFTQAVSLPSAKRCFSNREFQIHLRNPANDPLKRVSIALGGRHLLVARRAGRIEATVNLKGLPKGAFTVKIQALTVLGHRLSGSRTYHTCVSRSRSNRTRNGGARAKAHKHS
ncbi:MAG TPA: hypothetical protein VK761_06385 [Solirubrobacteraceae bacterium]|jgi:hypothetical protein|nr:hypothetical protein [Solirubrobacteraceae bacterium]